MRRAVSGKPDVLDCAPHFERMLYDNAQRARVYLHAWQVTGNELFRTVTEEILDYVVREMLDPEGGFYSTQDKTARGKKASSSCGRRPRSGMYWATTRKRMPSCPPTV